MARADTWFMRLTTTAGALRAALSTARHATPSSPSLVAYSGVLLLVKGNRLSVVGSDGETTIAALVTVTDGTDGQTLLPPRPIAAFLGTADADAQVVVILEEAGDVALLIGTSQPYRFRPIAATFPLPSTSRAGSIEVDMARLAVAVAAVRSSVSKDTPGVQLVSGPAGLVLHSTDNYRLSRVELPEAGFGDFSGVVALSVLERIARHTITSVSVDQRGSTLRCAGPDVVISSRLLSTPFPAVETILTNPPALRVTMSSSALHAALSRLQTVAEGSPLRCRISAEGFELSVSNIDLGSGTEIVPSTGTVAAPFEFAVSSNYLAEAVASHSAETIQIGFSTAQAPIFVLSTDPLSVTSVVMPVRL